MQLTTPMVASLVVAMNHVFVEMLNTSSSLRGLLIIS